MTWPSPPYKHSSPHTTSHRYVYCMCVCMCTVCVLYVYCMCISVCVYGLLHPTRILHLTRLRTGMCTVCVCVCVLYVYCMCTVCVYLYVCMAFSTLQAFFHSHDFASQEGQVTILLLYYCLLIIFLYTITVFKCYPTPFILLYTIYTLYTLYTMQYIYGLLHPASILQLTRLSHPKRGRCIYICYCLLLYICLIFYSIYVF
jgi:hypothetical protein